MPYSNSSVDCGPPIVRLQHLKYELENDKGLSLTSLLSSTSQIVFGEGNEDAKILIVGEAPGWQEARSGRPFVGKSGQYVRDMLARCGVDPVNDAFITNSVRIRPPTEKYDYVDPRNGRTSLRERDTAPKALAIESHLDHLRRLVCEIQPDIVLCFGRISSTLFYNDLSFEKAMGCESQYVMPDDELQCIPMREIHGKARPCFIEGMKRSVWAVPFYHPSYVMRNESEPKMQWLVRKWQGDCERALREYRTKSHMEAGEWLRIRDEEAGMTREARMKGYKWANPNQEFFKRPDSQSCEEIRAKEHYMFECNEIEYDSKKNEFNLFGRADCGDSVCSTVSGFQFHFYNNLPARLRQMADKQLQLEAFNWYVRPRDPSKIKLRRIKAMVEKKLEVTQDVLDRMLNEFNKETAEYLAKETHMDKKEIEKVKIEIVRRRNMHKMRNRFEPRDMFMRVWVNHHSNVRTLLRAIRTHTGESKLQHYETDMQAVERLTYDLKLRMNSWVEMPTKKLTHLRVRGSQPVSRARKMRSTCDVECSVRVEDLITHDPTDPNHPEWSRHAPQRIVALDIECLGMLGKFPKANNSPIINTSFEVQHQNDNTVTDGKTGVCKENLHYSFTMRTCAPIEGSHVFMFNDEQKMLAAMLNFIEQVDPDMMWGHNVKRFDLKYILDRMEYLRMTRAQGLKHMGRMRDVLSKVVEKKFQSRAFGERIMVNVPMAGRAVIDSLEVYMREKKLGNYQLNYLAQKYLKDTKNDMPYVAIPGFFWGSDEDNRELNQYCKKDAKLVIQLMNFHKWLFNIWEFARINGTVSSDGIYVRGQQIKVFSGVKHTINEIKPDFILPTKDRPVVFYNGESHEVAEKEYIEETYLMEGGTRKDKALFSADDLGYSDNEKNEEEEEEDSDLENEESDDEEEKEIWREKDEKKRAELFRAKGERDLKRVKKGIDRIKKKQDQMSAENPVSVGARIGVQSSLASFFKKAGASASVAESEAKRVSKIVVADAEKEVLSKSERSKHKWANTVGDVRRVVQERTERILKSKEEQAKRVLIKGANVFDAWVGLHIVPVLCADFASLYPSMMIRYNLSHETKVFECELVDRFLTKEDVYLSPIKGVPTHLKDVEFASDEERAASMQNMYFVTQEWMRTVFESDMDRLGITMDQVEDTGKTRVHPFKQYLHDLVADGTLYETLEELEIAADEVDPNELIDLQPERVFLLKDKREGMGILPLTLVRFLDARKVAKVAKANSEFGSTMFFIFDGRQLSLKSLANSTFGATSVGEGKLSDPDIGGTVTAFGRVSIELARDEAYKKWGQPDTVFTRGEDIRETKCVGGDTDSFFMAFCFVHTIDQGMEFGLRLVNYLNKFFVLPMKLEFEKVMMPLLIYAKKRYTGNLFSGEDNGDFFEKKRWMELHVPQEQWKEIFTMKRYPKEFESLEAFEAWKGDASAAKPVLSYAVDESTGKVTAMLDGPLHWWKNGVYKTKAEWYGYKDTATNKWVPGLLSIEQDRRNAQTDEEWMEDFRKPRYYGDEYNPSEYGRLFGKGIETVRRDALPLLSRTLSKFLKDALINGRVVDALHDMYKEGKKLMDGELNELELICSKKISKEVYKKTDQPHTFLQKKMMEDPDAYGIPPPELGDRVPFFITAGDDKKTKTYQRAEHPIRVIREGIPIDRAYYMKNKFMKPCIRTIQHFMDAPDNVIFDLNSLSNKRWSAAFDEKQSALGGSVVHKIQCLACGGTGTRLKPNTKFICASCMDMLDDARLRDEVRKQEERAKAAEAAHEEKLDKVCRPCTNTASAPCTYVSCQHWIPRIKLEGEAMKQRKVYEETCRVTACRLPDIEDLCKELDAKASVQSELNLRQRQRRATIVGKKRRREKRATGNMDVAYESDRSDYSSSSGSESDSGSGSGSGSDSDDSGYSSSSSYSSYSSYSSSYDSGDDDNDDGGDQNEAHSSKRRKITDEGDNDDDGDGEMLLYGSMDV